MNRKLSWLGVMIMMVGITLLWAAQPASAAITRWSKWKIDFAFPNNQMEAILTVQVGHTTSTGKKVIDQESTYPITCQMVGAVVMQNNEATFDGSSYFQCSVPSIRVKVAQMTSGSLIIPASCDSKRPYIIGSLTIASSPVQVGSNNPLFHRDDISFNLPLDVVTQEAQLVSEFAQADAESSSFPINPSGNTVSVLYNKTTGGQYVPIFMADSLSLSPTPAMMNGPIPLSTQESTVYVGYSPETGKYFEGSLESLLVDPYCVGTG